MGGRIDIEADHVRQLGGKLRVVRQFEGSDAVRRSLQGDGDLLA